MSVKRFSRLTRIQRRFQGITLTGCLSSTLLCLVYWQEGMFQQLGDVMIHDNGLEGKVTGGGNKVLILMWTGYYERNGSRLMNHGILRGREWNKSCCAGQVEVTQDRKQLDRATAIVFYGYFGNLRRNDLPLTRRPDQLWVLFVKESPHLSPKFSAFNNLFNWTMTYRSDSEIWAPYGQTLPLEEPIQEDDIEVHGIPLDEWVSGKTALLAGVTSNCRTQSKREDYIKQLKNIISLDHYGRCGTIKICHRLSTTCNHSTWWADLASKYKFYFAAENAICIDYISEKFWRTLEIGLVPVVYGGGSYTKEAPPNSFIDARDFPSHKELALRLVYLNSNDKEYRKYFSWRSKYKVRLTESWQGWCDLCQLVLKYRRDLEENGDSNTMTFKSHVYSDIGGWWKNKPFPENGSEACTNPDYK